MPTSEQTANPHPASVAAQQTLTLAITGASGSIYAAEMLRTLVPDGRVHRVNLVLSEHARRVLAQELGVAARHQLVERLVGSAADKIHLLNDEDVGANIASGSYPTSAMIVLPCSMGSLAAIAHGLAATLIQRAADVTLKERRPLVLCVRETPLNRIHLQNMLTASDAGATIFPAIPSFYNGPETTTEIARNFVHRVLAFIGLAQPDAYVWQPD